jgi:hypothetical protein
MNIRSTQPLRARIALVGLAAVALSFVAAPQSAAAYPPKPPTRSIALDAATQICRAEVPYIGYKISTTGFEPSEVASLRATVTVRNSAGNVVSGPFTGQALVGEVLYPGAKVDAAGNGTDWPGWKFVDGLWVPDSTDVPLRSGLRVEATVESSTVMGAVQYPAGSQVCLSPSGQSSPPAGSIGSVGPVGGAGVSGTLPDTGGSDPTRILWIAVAALLGGGVIWAASQRRHGAADSVS